MTATLSYTPIRNGYTLEPSYPVIEVKLDGGKSRKRQDVLYTPHSATVNWILTASEYTQFQGFFRTTLKNATRDFLLDIVSDIGVPTTHKCRTNGAIPKLTGQSGDAFYVGCTIEVDVNPTFTGLIRYVEPGRVVFETDFPFLVGPFLAGDSVRILYTEGVHPTGSTPLNLDGVYVISSTTDEDTLTLTSPASVNSDWTTLFGLAGTAEYGDETHGNVVSTITRVPT